MTNRMSRSALDQDSLADERRTRRGDSVSDNPVNATQERILRGAFAALGRHGSQSLSMSDVALASNVSRATLYRYFPTKIAVLEAVSEYISSTFLRGAEAIARNIDDPLQRLKAVMALQLGLATQDFITRIIEVEPGLVLKFLSDHYAAHLAVMRRVLDPLFDQLEQTSSLELDREVLAASILRMQLSTVVVPPDQRWRTSPDTITDMLSAFVRPPTLLRGKQKPNRKSR
jgi:AcrR family transcriptional regulator